MNELKRICDRVTIMRDGCVVKNSNINDISIDEIVSTMVGRKIDTNLQKNSAPPNTEIVLKVENLCGLTFKNISFELHKGEILGFAGLVGAGRTEVARAIFGAGSDSQWKDIYSWYREKDSFYSGCCQARNWLFV